MEKEKISVIVPVYNVEEWLLECVRSIQNQSYNNIEIILIDDGSSDNCPYMCDDFAAKDNRIKVIHKENGGVSSARNAGIEIATGKYITFIDSDDYVDKDYLLKLYNNLNGCDISECGTVCFDETGILPIVRGKPVILDWKSYLMETNLKGFLSYAVVYAKLYERELFSKVTFPVGQINGEDEGTVFKLVFYGKKVSRIYEGLYFYRQRRDGASQNSISDKRISDANALFDDKISFFAENHCNSLCDFFSAKKAIAFIGLYKQATLKEHKEYCKKIVFEMFKKCWYKKAVPLKYKLYITTFVLSQSFTGND